MKTLDATNLSDSSVKMSSAIEQTSSSMYELTQMIQKTLSSVTESGVISKEAINRVERGLDELSQLSKSISDVEKNNGEMFEPAQDKVYRHPTFYDLPDEVKHM